MAEHSKIEWCDHTFNPWIGCTKVSPGCANCYAEGYGKRFGVEWGPGNPCRRTSPANWKKPLAWNRKAAKPLYPDGTLWNDGDDQAAIEYKSPRVFCSLCDWLDPEVPAEWLADLLELIAATPHLTWLLLTKRPERWRERLEAVWDLWPDGTEATPVMDLVHQWLHSWKPPNVWLGATVEDQQRADERLPELLQIPARVRFLSVEPLLGAVDLVHMTADPPGSGFAMTDGFGRVDGGEPGIHWVIGGGESGPRARPADLDWFRSLRDQCVSAGVPFLFKGWGEWAPHPSGRVDPRDPREIYLWPDGAASVRLGKKASCRLLDGRVWDEVPRWLASDDDEPALDNCERCGHLMPPGCIGWCAECDEAVKRAESNEDFWEWGGWRRAFSEGVGRGAAVTIHELKVDWAFFDDLVDGSKTFEARKDDRGFKVGDTLLLREWQQTDSAYTGREMLASVTYVLRDYDGLQPGYVVMGIRRPQ